MCERHYFFLKAVVMPFVRWNRVTYMYVPIMCKLYSCVAVLYVSLESWPVVGFCPHVGTTGVFEINLNTLYPILGSMKEVFSTTNQAIRL